MFGVDVFVGECVGDCDLDVDYGLGVEEVEGCLVGDCVFEVCGCVWGVVFVLCDGVVDDVEGDGGCVGDGDGGEDCGVVVVDEVVDGWVEWCGGY